MQSNSGDSRSDGAGRTRRTEGPRRGWLSMSEKQTQAYLVAREALRRIRRAAALAAVPASADPDPTACSEATPRRGRHSS